MLDSRSWTHNLQETIFDTQSSQNCSQAEGDGCADYTVVLDLMVKHLKRSFGTLVLSALRPKIWTM